MLDFVDIFIGDLTFKVYHGLCKNYSFRFFVDKICERYNGLSRNVSSFWKRISLACWYLFLYSTISGIITNWICCSVIDHLIHFQGWLFYSDSSFWKPPQMKVWKSSIQWLHSNHACSLLWSWMALLTQFICGRHFYILFHLGRW